MDRSTLVFLAKLSEQAERYDDMVTHVKELIKTTDDELSVEERNLVAVAYKNVVGARRAGWRVMSSIERHQEKYLGTSSAKDPRVATYRRGIEDELTASCQELLQLLETHLLPRTESDEAKVFLHKTVGDYCRYLAEVQVGETRETTAKRALAAYTTASTIAMAELSPTHPIRLGLALNFSVFFYEILESPDRACTLAKRAFDDAIAELDTLAEDSYRDSTLVMQLLRDNLTLWASDADGDDDVMEKADSPVVAMP
ncbi:hypothetical protein P43SY_001843 [Pythium insidiosum]|uniref:14-3-3 domain-containing protein n=1 Tax=Pythium insidiosum TaxID=114742 RepID=A0AAD5Q414_PYTIN|nr:hypothetical protein P43SY_001843 [Pythium insidiosum]KAJ0404220.1 hypothetical protein ATCC90586_007993 [Pythium insidiosum]